MLIRSGKLKYLQGFGSIFGMILLAGVSSLESYNAVIHLQKSSFFHEFFNGQAQVELIKGLSEAVVSLLKVRHPHEEGQFEDERGLRLKSATTGMVGCLLTEYLGVDEVHAVD